MAKLIKGDHTVTTDLPREIVDLKARGYRVHEEPKAASSKAESKSQDQPADPQGDKLAKTAATKK